MDCETVYTTAREVWEVVWVQPVIGNVEPPVRFES